MSESVEKYGKSGAIEKDMGVFREHIKELSDSIGALGGIWNDSKYQELFEAVSQVVAESMNVVDASEGCMNYISRFDEIKNEEV